MLPYLFSSYDKNKFHKKLQNCKGGTILKWLVAKPLSRGQALGGVQGAEPPEAPRLRTKNQHFEPPLFFRGFSFKMFYLVFFFFFFFCRPLCFSGSGAPVDFEALMQIITIICVTQNIKFTRNCPKFHIFT